MTGLTPEMQRVWRRQNQLSGSSGQARFGAYEVCATAIRVELSHMGLKPSARLELGELAARHLLYWALMETPGIVLVEADDAEALQAFQDAFDEDDDLARALAWYPNQPPEAGVERFIYWEDDQPARLTSELPDISARVGPKRLCVVNLWALAAIVGAAVPEPLLVVSFDLHPVHRPIRRRLGQAAAKAKA